MSIHGGKRKGSGRPKGNPSKRMTIPYELVESVEKMILEYKALNQDSSSLEITPEKQAQLNLEILTGIQESITLETESINQLNKLIPKKWLKWYQRKNDPLGNYSRQEIKDKYGTLQDFVNAGGTITKNKVFLPD